MIYPWQQKQWEHVCKQHIKRRLPIALMLGGSVGLGQADFAYELARLMLCQSPQANAACGICRQCQLFDKGHHPDFQHVTPLAESRVIKVDQIRQLIEKTAKTPQLAERQVVVVECLEKLNIQAANALLKTLEQPPGDVTFLLVCHSVGLVPITVLSRCQKIFFYIEDEHKALQWLSTALESDNAMILLRLAEGAPLLAQEFHTRKMLILRETLVKLLQNPVAADTVASIELALKQDVFDVLLILRSLLEDCQKCHLDVSPDYYVHQDYQAVIARIAAKLSRDALYDKLTAILDTEKTLKRGIHINPQLALERIIL